MIRVERGDLVAARGDVALELGDLLLEDVDAALDVGLLARGVRLPPQFGLTGRQAESALLDAGVVTNRNSVPQDPNGAWYTTGVRFGTPALTTRGFGHDEFDKVAELVVETLSNTTPKTTAAGAPSKATYQLADGVAERVRAQSAEMLDKHQLYPGLELS